MNDAAHQNKGQNEKTAKRKTGGERRQENDFKKAACCPSAVVQGHHGKKWFVWGQCPGQLNHRKDQQPFRPNPKRGLGRHQHVEAVVD